MAAADEIEHMKKHHARSLQDMQADLSRKERELRELHDELRLTKDDLCKERETASSLKVCSSYQHGQFSLTTYYGVDDREQATK